MISRYLEMGCRRKCGMWLLSMLRIVWWAPKCIDAMATTILSFSILFVNSSRLSSMATSTTSPTSRLCKWYKLYDRLFFTTIWSYLHTSYTSCLCETYDLTVLKSLQISQYFYSIITTYTRRFLGAHLARLISYARAQTRHSHLHYFDLHF